MLTQWIRASFWGWLIGFVLTVVLAITWDTIGGGAQFMIGVAMGAGVGLMQGRVARQWLGSSRRWLLYSIVGMGAPFLFWDIGSALDLEFPFSLPLCTVAGGLLVGVLQWTLLPRSQFDRTLWWVPASLAGWGLPVALIAANDINLVPGLVGGLLSLVAMFLGGVVLGAVTGGALVWMRRRPAG